MIGKTISHYRIIEELGRGGMGIVYKAQDTKLKRTVALKFLPPELTKDPEAKKRFIHEAQAASALDHSNICTIHEVDETEDGQVFIAMACYDGETLKQKINKGPLPIHESIDMAIQMAQGLQEAHDKKIIHRDIKSANVILTDKGQVKIMDFGLAKLTGQTVLTKEGSTLGTVGYMSPEQTQGKKVDHRSDIWSMGVVLYEMITGRHPFQGDYDQAVMYSILNDDPEPVTALRTGVPIEFESVINKCLDKNPANRYQHVSELRVDLKRLQKRMKTNGSHVKPSPISGLKNTSRIIAVVIAACVVVLSASYLFFKIGPGAQTPGSRMTKETEWKNSVAVLPFRDYSPEKDQEHICFGMTDAINDRLSRIDALKVSSTTSVMRYKETELDPRDIGRELSVAHILEGSVQVENNRIRVHGKLINAETNFQVWSDRYDRELASIFEVQDEVSQAIAEALKIKLTPEAVRSLTRERPENMEAYEYYLKGMNRLTQALLIQRDLDVRASEIMFQEALKIDPGYALAYAGLAWLYLHHMSWTGDPESVRKFNQYADTAYEMEPETGTAMAVKGYKYNRDGDFINAFRLFRTALSINSNNSEIQTLTGFTMRQLGLYPQAKLYLKKAIDLNPFYTIQYGALFMAYYMNGDFEQAMPYLDRVFELNPNFPLFTDHYTVALFMTGQQDKVAEYLSSWEEKDFRLSGVRRAKAYLLAHQGKKKEALALSRSHLILLALGMEDEAIAYMKERLQNVKNYPYLHLKNNPLFDPLRDNDEFQKILEERKKIYETIMKAAEDL
ncbi:protein kinase [bacterium]